MQSEISYRIAAMEDRDELTELLNKHFYPDEPFNSGWTNKDPVPEDIDFTFQSLGDKTSFVAVHDAKNIIVGACLTGVDEPSSVQAMLQEADRTASKKWAEYLRLYARIDTEANIFQRFNVEHSFHVHCLVVHADYRGRAVAAKLVQKSFELAASLGYKMCSINCSSYYTEQVAQKLNMKCVSELAMDTVKSEEGARLIFASPPHTHVRTYIKQLWVSDDD